MIDIKDLMIGNYLYNYGKYGHKFCMRVEAVDLRKNKVLLDGDTKWYTVDKVLPVEIIGGWLNTFLEKHECKNGGIEYQKWFDGTTWLRVWESVTYKGFWHVSLQVYGVLSDLRSQSLAVVASRHELQNFFRILTGNDLI